MKEQWLKHCHELLFTDGQIPIGGGKYVLQNQVLKFTDIGPELDPSFGAYTQSKITSLKKAYTHEESIDMAIKLWDMRKNGRKYHSVGFSCYNHVVKSHANNHLSSIIGPCLQAVVVSGFKEEARIDIYYRSTEVFKKFSGDLVLIRNHFIPLFDFSFKKLTSVTMHISNVTLSPTYFPIPLVQMEDPIRLLRRLRRKNPEFYRGASRWIRIYFDPEHPPYSFNQANRVKRYVNEHVDRELSKEILSFVNSRE